MKIKIKNLDINYSVRFPDINDFPDINKSPDINDCPVTNDFSNMESKDSGQDNEYVFLLHGWGSDLRVFDGISQVISKKYPAVSVDFPGFGDSQEPDKPWDVSDYSDFILEFISHFKCKNVILLGHSFGGRVIIKTASQKSLPFKITKIILVDSAGVIPERTFKYKLKVRIYKAGKAFLTSKLGRFIFPEGLTKLQNKSGSEDYRKASEIMRSTLVKTVNEDLVPYMKDIDSPTLLIWGDKDTTTPLSDGQLMERIIPGSGLAIIKGGGHFSFLDRPEIFSRIIKSFLDIS